LRISENLSGGIHLEAFRRASVSVPEPERAHADVRTVNENMATRVAREDAYGPGDRARTELGTERTAVESLS